MFGAVWKRFNWLSEIVIPGVAAAMTAAWLTPLIYLLLHNLVVFPEGPAFSAVLVMALLLGGTLLDRLLRAQPGGRVRGLVVGLLVTIGVNALLYGFEPGDPGGWLSRWFAAIIDFDAGIHPALLTIPLTAALWAGGMAVDWEEYETIWTGFRWGVAGLAVCLVLTPYVAAEAMGHLATAVVAFLGWGLLALALRSVARALRVEKPADGHAGLSRQWLAVVTLVIAVLVLGGWMLGQATFLGAVEGLLAIVWPAIRWLLEIVAYVLAGILYLFALLLTPLTGDAERAETASLRPTFEVTTDLADQVQQLSESSGNVPASGINPGIIVVAIVAVVTVVLLALAWRRRRRPRPDEIMESRDSVWTPELLLEQWRSLWRRRPRALAAEPFLPLEGEEDTRQAVRRLYRQLLAVARRWGRPHRPGQTPTDLGAALSGLVPGEGESVSTLTQAYIVARYSPEPPTQEMVASAGQALARVEGALPGQAGAEALAGAPAGAPAGAAAGPD